MLDILNIHVKMLPLVGVSGIICASWLVLLAIYRVWLHPLANFPDPKLNAISSIPAIIAVLKGRLPMDTKLFHDKYRPVVRVSPNELSFSNADAWQDIYGHRNGHKNFHKDPVHVGSVEAVPGVTTLTMSDDENHARQRKGLSYAFSMKALLEQEDLINSHVTKLMTSFRKYAHAEESFNIVNWFNFTTFDVIGDLCFGEPFGCLDEGDWHFWVTMIYETVKSGAIEQATRRFARAGSPLQRFLMWFIPNNIRAYRRDHLAYSNEKTSRRLADTKRDHQDFIYYIIKNNDKRHDLSRDEILVNSALFIVAGSETTASFLSGWTNLLLRHKDCYGKLVEEIRTTFKSEAEIKFQVLQDLPYMNACIKEGLRIFPPVPAGLLRTVPKGGDTVDGNWIPGGTSVAVSSWAACHSKLNWRDPEKFLPERWLSKDYCDEKFHASQAFSLGPRGCIGRHLPYMEMRLIMSRLLWNFDIESADGAEQWEPSGEMKYMRAYLTWEKPELNIRLIPVQR